VKLPRLNARKENYQFYKENILVGLQLKISSKGAEGGSLLYKQMGLTRASLVLNVM
jgi:hypothetical protein